MPAFKDITGQQFGRLTVVARAMSDRRGQAQWRCRCACGNETTVNGSNLRRGNSQSCGCLKRDVCRTHGMSRDVRTGKTHALYAVWHAMLQRCQNPGNSNFPRYGGRGIYVCEHWMRFADFYADMGDRPSPVHSLDRIDNDGPYSPDNCRWTTVSEQNKNKRRSTPKGRRLITAFGQTMNLAQWSRKTGLPFGTIRTRLKRGWHAEKALTP
jgi:hypothetical protein